MKWNNFKCLPVIFYVSVKVLRIHFALGFSSLETFKLSKLIFKSVYLFRLES